MKIGVAGYAGRVGQVLYRELSSGAWPDLELAAVSVREHGNAASLADSVLMTDSPIALMNACDCVIDFTTPESTLANLAAARDAQTSLVIGTTGLSTEAHEAIENAALFIPIVVAANMSVGVNILLALVEQAASRLGPEWDIEIFEAHHRHKIDAPSGTALALGKAAHAGRGAGDFAIDRAGKRKTGDIGYAVSRGGDVVGEHMVTFYGAGERIELGHKAADRALFARGALTAARWIGSQPPGLYSMRDVLAL